MTTFLLSKKAIKRERAPQVKATVLRDMIWQKYGKWSATVRTTKRGQERIINVYVKKQEHYTGIAEMTVAFDETIDVPDKQIVNLISYHS